MNNKKYNVAIVGATGAVGETMLSILEERDFPIAELALLASSRSVGQTKEFMGRTLEVQLLDDFDFSTIDIALFSAGGSVSAEFAPKAANQGAVVIDNTSFFRYEEDVPLVVPEINPQAIAEYKTRGIIANPNCSTIQMMVALKPLHDIAPIERITVSTYQAVSGSGQSAINELVEQTKLLFGGRPSEPKVYPKPIAFNVLPHIDVFQGDGYSKEEMKMVWETHKILGDDSIEVNPTTVRVPVLYGHSEAVHIRCKSPIEANIAREILRTASGVEVIDNLTKLQYPTAFTHAAGNDPVYVGRIRQDLNDEKGLNLWIVADNVRKGAALNAVQIAEILINEYI